MFTIKSNRIKSRKPVTFLILDMCRHNGIGLCKTQNLDYNSNCKKAVKERVVPGKIQESAQTVKVRIGMGMNMAPEPVTRQVV